MSELSWWGWGRADEALDSAELAALAERVRPLLRLDGDVTAVPALGDLALPDARVRVPAALAAFSTTAPGVRAAHTYGKAFRDVVRALRGDFAVAPDVVAAPRDEAEVVAVLDWAGSTGVAVIPFGGGTSVVGGVECRDRTRPVLSLDLRGLTGVIEVDTVSRQARVRAGTLGPDVAAGLRPHGLMLRHYPQSYQFSTVGGWIATRAGGHNATGSTRIDDAVAALRVVTPVGVAESARVPSSGAGPDPDRLWLGSEGTLGIITEAWLRVRPPAQIARTAFAFTDFDQAVQATREIVQAGLWPAECRALDAVESMLGAGVTDGGSRLLLSFESDEAVTELQHAIAICTGLGGDISGPATQATREWRESFLRAPYLRDGLVRLGVVVETFETACTWQAFPELRAGLTAALDGTGAVLACRFAFAYPDGPAPYFTVFAPGRRGGEVEQWDELKAQVSDALLAHGGTITHHHAVGRDHQPWYEQERPEPFAVALRAAKSALDPHGILNPGVLVSR